MITHHISDDYNEMTVESKLKVSIITACLNSGKTIRRTIESVLNQTYGNIEYIIIDGGSTDDTLNIITEYKDRIDYFISEKDNGIYDAFNKGIRAATGDIIGIINSDDWYTCDAVEASVEELIEKKADLCCGNIIIVENELIDRVYKSDIETEQWCGAKIRHPSVFASKKLYNEIGLFDDKYSVAADYKWLLEVILHKKKLSYIDKEVTYFRIGGISTDAKHAVLTASESYQVVKDLIEKYDLTGYEYYRALDFWQSRAVWIQSNELFEHKSEKIAEFIRSHGPISIWGSGHYGMILLNICRNYDVSVSFLVDSDNLKQKNKIYDLEVMSPERLGSSNVNVVIAIDKNEDDLLKLSLNYGIEKSRVITLWDIRRLICPDL